MDVYKKEFYPPTEIKGYLVRKDSKPIINC